MNTKLLTAAALTLVTGTLAACGSDDVCGPDDAPNDGITVAASEFEVSLSYGEATTSPNNDCSVDEAPTSLTIDLSQVAPLTPSRRALILCVPRPDLLDDPLTLTDDAVTTGVQVIDIFADVSIGGDDCLVSIDRTRPVSGTATFTGACDDGTNPAGYALELAGTIPATANCAGTDMSISLSLSGTTAVEAL